MTREAYIRLYEKYLAGKCSPEEEQQLQAYQDEFDLSKQPWDESLMGNKQETKAFIFSRIQGAMQQEGESEGESKKAWFTWWYAAAAVALLVLAGSIYLGLKRQQAGPPALASEKNKALQEISPGSNKAVLTLADGSEIVLDHARNGALSQQGKLKILKPQDGQITYNAAGKGNGKDLYNQIKTPRGGQYQVVLADGTKVWLNAASSLRFPANLSGKERRVELRGEAYFEVAPNKKKPFKIEANGVEIEVLGTHFNVMAYGDEQEIKTTLIEGSVKLHTESNKMLLAPGHRAVFSKKGGRMTVIPVDVEEDIAWKNGVFIFNNEDIKSIMRKVSRWYDVDIRYEGNLSGKDFAGTVPRSENLAGVLKMLELTGAVHFKMEERSVIVMP